MERYQLENARFMMKYLENANGQQYRNYFCSFNDKMFAQVSTSSTIPKYLFFTEVLQTCVFQVFSLMYHFLTFFLFR